MASFQIGKFQFLVAIPILLNLLVSETYAGSCRQLCDEHFMRTASKKMIEKEIQWGADINEIDKETGKNALHTASIVGNSTAIRILLKNGVDINAPHFQGGGALTFAAFSGSLEAVKILINASADVNGLISSKGSPLMGAAMSGSIKIVIFLLAKGADPNRLFEGSFGALAGAASNGRLSIMTLLLEAGAKVNAGAGTDGSPIWAAMLHNSVAAIELLIKNGANVNITGKRERPLLIEAIGLTKFGRIEPQTVELLLAGGANPNVRGIRGESALSLVLRGKGKENQLLKILLQNGANPNLPTNINGPSMLPIFMAVVSSNYEGVNILSDRGANVNSAFTDSSTPLHLAAEEGVPEIVQLLLSKGADPTIKNNGGLTPLDIAVNKKKLDVIKILIKAGGHDTLNLGGRGIGEGLDIRNVKSHRKVESGVDTLIILGEVANVSKEDRIVPMIKVALYDGKGIEIQSTIVAPLKNRLLAGGKFEFVAKLSEPSAMARRLEVTFTDP